MNNASESNKKGIDFWQPHIEACQQSGLSKRRYCQQHKLAYHRYLYWLSKLSQKSQPSNTQKLLRLKLAEDKESQALATLQLKNGLRLFIHHEATLLHLIEQLG